MVRFDFGAKARKTQDAWNNVHQAVTAGVLVRDAIDAERRRTSLDLRQVDGWSGINVDGCVKGGPWPGSATRDSFYVGDHDDRRAVLWLEDLTPGAKVDLLLYGSRIGAPGDRVTVFRVGKARLRLDAQDNVSRRARIAKAVADSRGRIEIVVEAPKPGGLAYLGVLEVRGTFQDAATHRAPAESVHGPPHTTARTWAIADGRTGHILHEHFGHAPREMASTTKIMTAWIALDLADRKPGLLDGVVTVSAVADRTGGSTAGVRTGERLPLKELLFGLLLPSGNDAAVAIAEYLGPRLPISGSGVTPVARFVDEMNRRARVLGLKQTLYLDPHGYSKNRTCAVDLLKLTWTAMQNSTFRSYVATRTRKVSIVTPSGRRREAHWTNTNRLLAIDGYDGVKTGVTRTAGSCLVSSGRRADRHLLVAVLGATSTPARDVDTRNLFRWAWRQ